MIVQVRTLQISRWTLPHKDWKCYKLPILHYFSNSLFCTPREDKKLQTTQLDIREHSALANLANNLLECYTSSKLFWTLDILVYRSEMNLTQRTLYGIQVRRELGRISPRKVSSSNFFLLLKELLLHELSQNITSLSTFSVQFNYVVIIVIDVYVCINWLWFSISILIQSFLYVYHQE